MRESPPAGAPPASAPQMYGDVAELLAGATERSPLAEAPGKSGASLERVVIGGQRYMVKHLDLADDWTMRASGCLRGAPLELWERGILARLPGCFNQPIVGAAPEDRAGPAPSGGCALLMRDVTPWLVPVTDAPIALDQHLRFLRHMAALHASFWDCGSEFDVVPAMHRYLELSPWTAQAEAAIGSAHLVPQLVAKGWPLLAQVAPAAAAVVTPLALDPGPLVEALASTPHTFVHSNWKLDNLGTDDAGRTVILDWEQPGQRHGSGGHQGAGQRRVHQRRAVGPSGGGAFVGHPHVRGQPISYVRGQRISAAAATALVSHHLSSSS
jgi:hypothetical protein